jgi:hypothetical protein
MGTSVHGDFSAWGLQCMGTSVHGDFSAWGLQCMGTSVHGDFSAWGLQCMGTSVHGDFSARGLQCTGTSKVIPRVIQRLSTGTSYREFQSCKDQSGVARIELFAVLHRNYLLKIGERNYSARMRRAADRGEYRKAAGAAPQRLKRCIRRLSRRQENCILELISAGVARPHIADTTTRQML